MKRRKSTKKPPIIIDNDERRYERYMKIKGIHSRQYLLQRLDNYYGGYEKRIHAIGLTCLDCRRQSCPENCIDKSRMER